MQQQLLDVRTELALMRAESALAQNRIGILETADPNENIADADRLEHDLDNTFMNNAVNSPLPRTPNVNPRSTRASRGGITPGPNRNQNQNQNQTQTPNATHSNAGINGSNPMNQPRTHVEHRRSGPPAQAPSYTQITMSTVFAITKPITELTIITVSALKRALMRDI